jgi:hypothetical protein
MTPKGLLIAMMEPPAGFEEEFQDWYDTEHVPERMALKEFETGRRFVCSSGFPKYIALYDLSSLEDVARNAEYSKATGQGVSAWTHRLRTKVLGRYRFTGDQIYPGGAKMGDSGAVIRLLLLRFRGASEADEKHMLAGLRENFDNRSGFSQLRLFRGAETAGDYIATVEFHTNVSDVEVKPRPFGPAIKRLDLINAYVPYWREIIRRKVG